MFDPYYPADRQDEDNLPPEQDPETGDSEEGYDE
jgi:hypothetical protein